MAWAGDEERYSSLNEKRLNLSGNGLSNLFDMSYKNIEQRRAYFRKRYRENRQELIELRSKPCTDCKQTYPHYVMEFDHARGKKRFNIASLGQGRLSDPMAQEELAKCDLVCANCHKVRTYKRSQGIEIVAG